MASGRFQWLPAAAGALGVVIATIIAGACSHESPAAPASVAVQAGACAYVVSPSGVQISVAGGTFQVAVSVATGAASGCQWTMSTSDAWIHPVSPATASVAGTVMLAVDSTSLSGRQGSVTVSWPGGSHSINVTQGCVETRTENLTADSQLREVGIGSLCSFAFNISKMSIDVPWIRFYMSHGNGSLIDFLVDANSGPERTGHVTWDFGQITFVQSAGNCVTAIAPSGQAFDENGGSGTITVTAVPDCAWQATPHDGLGALKLLAGAQGSGSGVVTFSQGVNPDPLVNSPWIIVGGTLKFQITQSACPVTVSPLNFHVPAAGGSFSIAVTSREICRWTDYSNASFITRTSPGNVTGSGTVQFSVAQNQTGQARSGSLYVAAQTVTVTQDP